MDRVHRTEDRRMKITEGEDSIVDPQPGTHS